MGLIDYTSKGCQAINVTFTSVILLASLGVLIYSIVAAEYFWTIYSTASLLLCLKSLHNDTRVLNMFRGIKEDLESGITDLDRNNRQLRAEVTDLTEENAELKSSITEIKRVAKEAKAEVDNLKKIGKEQKKRLDDMTDLKNKIHTENLSLQKGNKESAAIRDQLQHQNHEYQTALDDMQYKLNRLNELIRQHEHEIVLLRTQRDDITAQITLLEMENAEFKISLQELNNIKESLEEQNKELKQMYIEATNLYKNLVVMGDRFTNFESKFKTTADILKEETDTLSVVTDDIRTATDALSAMVNEIADSASDDQRKLVRRSKRKFRNVILRVMEEKRAAKNI